LILFTSTRSTIGSPPPSSIHSKIFPGSTFCGPQAARQIVTVGEGRGILRDAVRWLTLLALCYRLLTERQLAQR